MSIPCQRCWNTLQWINKSSTISWLTAGQICLYICLTALCPGLPRWAGTRKVNPIWILLEQETVGGSGISWAICKSAPRSRQITTPAPHHSVFYRPDALPATQPTASKHWRQQEQWKPFNSNREAGHTPFVIMCFPICWHNLSTYKAEFFLKHRKNISCLLFF